MPPLHTLAGIERPRLARALDAAAPRVALVGPRGAGATTLLRQYAAGRSDVSWAGDGYLPERTSGVLIVDGADGLEPEQWQQLQALCEHAPELLVRLAVRSRRSVPSGFGMEWVDGLSFTEAETTEYLAVRGSHLRPRDVQTATGGLPAAVAAVVHANAGKSATMRAVLARASAGTLPTSDAPLAVPDFLTDELVEELGGARGFIERVERLGFGEWGVSERGRCSRSLPRCALPRSKRRRSPKRSRRRSAGARRRHSFVKGRGWGRSSKELRWAHSRSSTPHCSEVACR